MQKSEWPGGIEPALARHLGAGLYGPELSGHSYCNKPKLAILNTAQVPSPSPPKSPKAAFVALIKLHNDKRQEV